MLETLSLPTLATTDAARDDFGSQVETVLVTSESLDLQGLLGVGGMAQVHEAQQYSLGRRVAVKTAQGGGEESLQALMREARVTSRLEHPNIVPIYTIAATDQGDPAIILRKIAGTPWSELIRDPERVARDFNRDDLFVWNMEVLIEVSNAVRFAHSEGFLHRDIKPSNVLVGRFGEVYLCDWGIALSMRAEDGRAFELASEAQQKTGTLAYMAPEMLDSTVGNISERSDIFLLGAVLYEILEGRGPHTGSSEKEVMAQIRRSRPDYSGCSPIEVKEICKRCMAPAPNERFQSVEELQSSLRAYLCHRSSHKLAERGLESVEHLARQIAVGSAVERDEIYSMLSACRLVLQEATAAWSGNQVAWDGLDRAIRLVVEYELSNGEVAAAAALVVELHSEDEALQHRIQRASEELQSRQEEYSMLRRDADLNIGAASRRRATVWLGVGWVLVPLLLANLLSRTTYLSQFVSHAGFVGLWLGLGVFGRDWIQATVVNRNLYRTLLSGGLLAMVFNIGSQLSGVAPDQAQVYHLFIFFSIGVSVSVTSERRAWPTALGFLCAYLVAAQWPSLTLWAMAVANLGLAANALVIWNGSHEPQHSTQLTQTM